MITASFKKTKDHFYSVSVSGHALFDQQGKDIVCAAVTSGLQLTANGITEVLKTPAQLLQAENTITLTLPQNADPTAFLFLEALHLHLTILSEDYPKNLTLTLTST